MLQLSKILNIKCKDQKISKVIDDFYSQNNIFDKSSLVITLIYLKRYSEKVNISLKIDVDKSGSGDLKFKNLNVFYINKNVSQR